jgi:hypothetical protein
VSHFHDTSLDLVTQIKQRVALHEAQAFVIKGFYDTAFAGMILAAERETAANARYGLPGV